jgi:hypothetical protein
MKEVRLNKAVKRMTVLKKDDESGTFMPVVEYRQGRKRKKMSRGLRFVEKFVRRISKARAATANVYAERHERSNRKKKDGWLKNLIPNVVKAQRKGIKILRK